MFMVRIRLASGSVTHGPFPESQRDAWIEIGRRGCLVDFVKVGT